MKMDRVRLWLLVIIVVAVILRVGASLYMGDRVQDLPGIYDQISYDRLAQNLLAGHGFSFDVDWWPATRAGEPTAHWSYLMTSYLFIVYKVFGYHPLMARLIQAILAGILMPWLTFLLGKRLIGERVGLLAAGISAVYIYFFYYAAALMTETFFFLAVLGSLYLALSFVDRPGWKKAIAFGISVGCAILLRQLFLLILPFLIGWIIWATRKSFRMHYILGMLLVPALMILPWTVRNYFAFHQFVLLNTNAGYAFFWANHPIYGTNFLSILPSEYPSYKGLIPPELLSLDEASLDRALLNLGLGFVLNDPGRYILLSINRIKDYFLFWPLATSGLLSNISRVGSFGIFLPFMLYGLVISFSSAKMKQLNGEGSIDQRAFALIYLFILAFTGIHLLSWSYVRYRLPVDTVLIIFASIGLLDLLRRLKLLWFRSSQSNLILNKRNKP
jgi:4-amino-4-deoxy-L-arabinose transferase-like glycosyltransferase